MSSGVEVVPSERVAASAAITRLRKLKARFIRKYKARALFDDEIEREGARLFGNAWGGVSNQANIKPEPSHYYIVNTARTEAAPGAHWVALITGSGSTAYLFDSFGRDSVRLLPYLLRRLKKAGFGRVVDCDYDAEQRGASEVCGHLALSWLVVARDLGIRRALEV